MVRVTGCSLVKLMWLFERIHAGVDGGTLVLVACIVFFIALIPCS